MVLSALPSSEVRFGSAAAKRDVGRARVFRTTWSALSKDSLQFWTPGPTARGSEVWRETARRERSMRLSEEARSEASQRNPTRPLRLRAQKSHTRTCGDGQLAEGEGFEPPVRLPAQRFSRPPRSTTPASLRRVETVVTGCGVSKGSNRGRQGRVAGFAADRLAVGAGHLRKVPPTRRKKRRQSLDFRAPFALYPTRRREPFPVRALIVCLARSRRGSRDAAGRSPPAHEKSEARRRTRG